MTTSRKPMSGRAQSGNIADKMDKYNKASKGSAVGTFMRTFSRTKTSNFITAWNDVHYFTVKNCNFKFLADNTGAVDSATVGDPGGLVLLDVLWETYYENANLKDLVANDEAAWKIYFLAMIQICVEIQIQYNMRCYLPAYTEADDVPGSNANISYFDQSSFDIFVASMKDYPVPKMIYDIVDIFCTWVVKLTEAYERYTLRIPAAIYQPFNCSYDLADLQAMRALLRVNLGGMTTHAQKYGLSTGAWRDPIKPIEKSTSDPDVIAYFNHSPFKYFDNQPAQVMFRPNGGFTGTDLTDDYTLTEYFFKDNPNESPLHVLAAWFGDYDATNNPYGGFIHHGDCTASEYYLNFMFTSQHGVGMTAMNLGDAIIADTIITLHKVAWDNKAATLSLNFNGTNFTAAKGLDDCWMLATTNLLFTGKGRGAKETNDDLINFLGRKLK